MLKKTHISEFWHLVFSIELWSWKNVSLTIVDFNYRFL